MAGVDGLVDAVTRWYLSEGLNGDLGETIEAGRAGFAKLAAAAPRLGDDERRRERRGDRRAGSSRRACPRASPTPTRCAPGSSTRRPWSPSRAPPSCRSRTSRSPSSPSATCSRSTTLESELDTVPVSGRMQRWALQAVREDARRVRREIAERALKATPSAGPEEAVSDLLAAHLEDCRRSGRVHAHALARVHGGHGRDRVGGAAAALAGGRVGVRGRQRRRRRGSRRRRRCPRAGRRGARAGAGARARSGAGGARTARTGAGPRTRPRRRGSGGRRAR